MYLSASLEMYIFFKNQDVHSFSSFSIHLDALHLSENMQENKKYKEENQECQQSNKHGYTPFKNKNTKSLLFSVFY